MCSRGEVVNLGVHIIIQVQKKVYVGVTEKEMVALNPILHCKQFRPSTVEDAFLLPSVQTDIYMEANKFLT